MLRNIRPSLFTYRNTLSRFIRCSSYHSNEQRQSCLNQHTYAPFPPYTGAQLHRSSCAQYRDNQQQSGAHTKEPYNITHQTCASAPFSSGTAKQ